jgi:hypothetical protein
MMCRLSLQSGLVALCILLSLYYIGWPFTNSSNSEPESLSSFVESKAEQYQEYLEAQERTTVYVEEKTDPEIQNLAKRRTRNIDAFRRISAVRRLRQQ